MVTLLKPITPVAPRYEPNLLRTGVTALADLMITIEMLLAPHTVCFFTTATKEHLISRLSDELQSSAWSQIKGH